MASSLLWPPLGADTAAMVTWCTSQLSFDAEQCTAVVAAKLTACVWSALVKMSPSQRKEFFIENKFDFAATVLCMDRLERCTMATVAVDDPNKFGVIAPRSEEKKVSPYYRNEGLPDDEIIRSGRSETIALIHSIFEREKVLLLRAPPFSGKTSFVRLYAKWLTERGNCSCLAISMLRCPEKRSFGEFFFEQFQLDFQALRTVAVDTYVLIDEVQMLYVERHTGGSFWSTIKSLMSDETSKLRVLLVASHGEPRASFPMSTFEAPAFRLCKAEFKELIHNYHTSARGRRVPLYPALIDMIWSSTLGHAGLVRRALHQVEDHFLSLSPTPPTPPTIKEEDQIRYLLSPTFIDHMMATRAFPQRSISDAERDIILRCIHEDPSVSAGDEATAHQQVISGLIVSGHLVRNGTSLEFAAPLIRHMMIRRYICSPERGPAAAVRMEFNDFMWRILGVIRPPQLCTTVATGSDSKMVEAHWRNEVYRAATTVLPSGRCVSPEVSRVFGSDGVALHSWSHLDVYIDSDLCWGIEIMREGDQLQDFGINGKYYRSLRLKQWAILDFRSVDCKRKRGEHSNLWTIVYSADYTHAIVHFGGKETRIERTGTTHGVLS